MHSQMKISIFCHAALQFQFISEVVFVLEGSSVATVCIRSLNSVLRQDVTVVLVSQDGTAIGTCVKSYVTFSLKYATECARYLI